MEIEGRVFFLFPFGCRQLSQEHRTKFNKLIDINYFFLCPVSVHILEPALVWASYTFLIEWKREHAEISARLCFYQICVFN